MNALRKTLNVLSLLAFGMAIGLFLAPPAGAQKAPPAAAGAKPANADPRALLRDQVEAELAQLRPRLKLAEAEAKEQAERYSQMAASKAEVAKKSALNKEKDKAKADADRAKGGYKPRMPRSAAKKPKPKKKGEDDEEEKAKAEAAAAAASDQPKKIDPVLTQQYVVLSLRDQIRQLRDRIAYLEEIRARLGAKS
ncbi:MAG: hypothetical protein JNM30_01590 [Rhodospirillales bacterium]|nr:hypothetical protein [Rhodospirillales bacterium]